MAAGKVQIQWLPVQPRTTEDETHGAYQPITQTGQTIIRNSDINQAHRHFLIDGGTIIPNVRENLRLVTVSILKSRHRQ